MYIGHYLPQTPLNSPLIELFSPWFPRQGDGAYFTVQVIDRENLSPEPDLQVRVYHRATDATGSGTEVTTSWDTYSDGFMTCNMQVDVGSPGFDGFLEMVRFSFSCVNGWLVYRALPPIWFDKG